MSNVKYDAIDSTLFAENRKRFQAELKKDAVAVFHSNRTMPRSGDVNFPFRQNSDLFYLSGIDQEETILVLCPGHTDPHLREVLFVRETSDHVRTWEGYKLTIEEAAHISGIEHVVWTSAFDAMLIDIMEGAKRIYLDLSERDQSPEAAALSLNVSFAHRAVQDYPEHKHLDFMPIMQGIRMIKSQPEIILMERATAITHKAFLDVLGAVKPGIHEHEIEARMTHTFLDIQATGHGYPPVIASGADTCIMHYGRNNKQCKDGDLLLMDFGAEYANYVADVTRTIPVNGVFTERQRAVYTAVLRAHKRALEFLVPGNTIEIVNREVGKVLEDECVHLELFTQEDVKKQDEKEPLYRKYFPHNVSHFLGLDAHDVGDRSAKFAPGMVLTNEPGLYIIEEGIGIRLENDILITEEGNRDLTADIPLEIDEIESMMGEGKSVGMNPKI